MKKILLRKNNLLSNMALSGICKPISMVISYIYVPIVLNYLGVEKYGVWATILTILSWISYFDIGIGNGLRNKLTESLSKKDGLSRQLVSSAYAFIAFIMLGVTLVFSICATFIDWHRIFGVSNIEEDLTSLVVMSVIFVAINFILSICKNILYAQQKASYVSVMELITQVLNLSGVLIAKKIFQSNLFIMALIYGLSMLLVNLVVSVVMYSRNYEVRPLVQSIDLQIGKGLASLGLKFFVIQICALILFTTDSLIISYLYGASSVTPYATVNKMFNVIIGVYTALLAPIWSAVTKAKVEKRYAELEKLIWKLKLIMLPFVVGTLFLMAIFRPAMRLWLGQELDYSKGLIVFGGIYCLLFLWSNIYSSIANGMELMNVSMFVSILQAIVNIPISLFCAETLDMKSAGVLAGTTFSLLIGAIIVPTVVHKTIRDMQSEPLYK